MEQINNSKRLFKNTIVLYVRMVITMLIALYTSRVVLAQLGVSDYGLYNVVGGVVALFSFMQTSMTSATQRFLSFELGKADKERLSDMFSMSLTTHIILSGIILILCETIGLWFLNSKINIPEGREVAANWLYQFSVFTLSINMIVVPFSACVISHERMTIFAYISIIDSIMKLCIALSLIYAPFDKLIFYGVLMMSISVVNLIIYRVICRKRFPETKYRLFFDKQMFLQIFSFSGWTLLGQLAVVGAGQGTTILTNIFHSVTANAAMGIAQQANGAISGLVSNFQTAYQPQITKSYAVGNWHYLYSLIYNASKVSYFLLFIVSLPIIFNIDWLLSLWLGNVPEYTSEFVIYFLIASMLNAIGGPLWMSVFASGKIRNYQIASSITFLFDIVLVYLLFAMGMSPIAAVLAKVFTNFIVIFVRLVYARHCVQGFSVRQYCYKVLVPILISSFISFLASYILFSTLYGVIGQIIATIVCVAISTSSVYFIALNQDERKAIFKILK